MNKIKQNHNELFAELQTLYLATTDETSRKKILGDMYVLLIDYYRNLIANYALKRCLRFHDSAVEEKSLDMASRTIEHYLRRPDFQIGKLSSYAHFDFIKIMSAGKEWDRTESFEQIIENYDDNEPIMMRVV